MKLKIWELALFTAFVLTFLWAALIGQRQADLSDRLIRLHVVAHSDCMDDQAMKLYVRDRILAEIQPLLNQAGCRNTAKARITENLPQITATAEHAVANWGSTHPVTANLLIEGFPTRTYAHFTLPAGQYSALRVDIGEAGGQNWWCLVFPPLCLEVATAPSDMSAMGLNEDEIALITGGEEGYALRFRTLEVLEGIRARFGRG